MTTRPQPPRPRRRGLATLGTALTTALVALAGPLVAPSTAAPLGSMELTTAGRFVSISQVDLRWSAQRMAGDEPIGRCGCQLSAFTSLVGHYMGQPATLPAPAAGHSHPLFPSPVVDTSWRLGSPPYTYRIIDETHNEWIFSPYYLHLILEQSGGYLGSGCGTGVQPYALERVAQPVVVPTAGGGEVRIGPRGMAVDYLSGFDTAVIDANLAMGRPTIVGRHIPEGGKVRQHVNIITGYDAETGRYRWVDPTSYTGAHGTTIPGTTPAADQAYWQWTSTIVTTIDTYPIADPQQHTVLTPIAPRVPNFNGSSATAATVDVELGAVLADGTLVGYDPATGEHHQFRGHFDWDHFGATPIDDPDAGIEPGSAATAGLMLTDVDAGTVRTRIVPTASGEYAVQLHDVREGGAVDNDLAIAQGTAVAGDEIKHEITYAADGSAVAIEVDDFSPEVVVESVDGIAGEAVALDASDSFDADGTIEEVAWDFGDGTTGTGATPTHTWEAPGTYEVTVTVTSGNGVARTETVTATMAPSETDEPTVAVDVDPARAADGWTNADSVTVTATGDDAAGTGVASVTLDVNGDPTTTAGDTASVTVTDEGATPISVVATDRMGNTVGDHVTVGIDRTAPVAEVVSPAADRPVRALSFVTGTADDGEGSGIDRVEVQVRRADGSVVGDDWFEAGGEAAWWLSEDELTALPDGTYTVQARAIDQAGNAGVLSDPATVVVAADAAGGTAEIVELLPSTDGAQSVATSVSAAGEPYGGMWQAGFRERAQRWTADGAEGAYGEGTELAPIPTFSGAHVEGVSPGGAAAVGWSESPIGVPRATAWIDGTPHDLGTVDGGRSEARDVNDAGVAVGSSTIDPRRLHTRATVFEDGDARFLPDLGGTSSVAQAVNEDGVAVGYSFVPGNSAEQAFLTDGETAVALESPDPSTPSTANDINDDGIVVGSTVAGAARWVDGELELLFEGQANAVADDGAVVGNGPDGTAVLWRDGELVDLNDLIDPTAGWVLYEARDISADGSVIVGVGERLGRTRGFRLDLDGGDGGPGAGDVTPPATAATVTPAEAADGWVNQAVSVALSATDPGDDASGVERIDVAGQPAEAGATRTVVIDDEGTTALAWSAVDAAGNVEVPPGTATVRIDRTAPTATIGVDGEPAAGWHTGPVVVDATGIDTGGSGIDSVAVTVDGTAPTGATVDGDGEHVVTAVAADRAGNVGEPATATVRIDGTGPEVAFGFDPGPVRAGTLAGFAATDATSGIAAVLATVTDANGVRFVDAGEALTTPGSSTLTVTAFDAAGNVTSASRTVTIAGPGPVPPPPASRRPVADAGGPYAAAVDQPVTFDGSRSSDPDGDALTYQWSVDHAPIAAGKRFTVALLDPGVHTVGLVVSDGVHQSEPVFTTFTVTERTATALTAAPVVLRLKSLFVYLGTFEARLTDGAGRPVAGEPVRFEVLGQTRCTATTNASGVARCQAQLLDGLLAVLFPYTARYDGDDVRLPSANQARLIR